MNNIGIYSQLNKIKKNDLDYLIDNNFIIYIIDDSNNNELLEDIYYLKPEIFNSLDISLNFLYIVDDLNYFINWSFKSKVIIVEEEIRKTRITLFENIKDNITELKKKEIDLCDILKKYDLKFDYILEFDDYEFVSNIDVMGYDIFNVNPNEKTIREMKNIADNLEDCKCFNTWGYFKNKIDVEKIFLKNKFHPIDGIYIKKT
jgi:hypothetical protein